MSNYFPLGIYLVALELTMLSTVIPTLTNEFGTLNDVSWYESAYGRVAQRMRARLA